MSGRPDSDDKTEEPTERRRTEALEREGGPVSREAGNAVTLLVFALLLYTTATGLFGDAAAKLSIFIEDPGGWRLENAGDAIRLMRAALSSVSGIIIWFAGAIVAASIAASVLQNTPRLNFERILPDLSRISPDEGLHRLFSAQSLKEFFKGMAKMALAGFAAYYGLGGLSNGFLVLHATPGAILEILRHLLTRMVFIAALLACLIAAVDIFMTRRSWHRGLMMSKQELKEEIKQTEGDAMIKLRIRAIARARIKRQMMKKVPKATLVVANPTHYAVAMRYVKGEESAPKVVAKGQGFLALKIREIAEEHGIPVVENKALAKSLYLATQEDQLIPQEFYKAVAEIIIYLSAKGKPGQAPRSKPPLKPWRKPPL